MVAIKRVRNGEGEREVGGGSEPGPIPKGPAEPVMTIKEALEVREVVVQDGIGLRDEAKVAVPDGFVPRGWYLEAMAQVANLQANLREEMNKEREPEPELDLIVPAFVGPAIPQQLPGAGREPVACYETTFTVRVLASDLAYLFGKVDGHKVGLKFVRLEGGGT